MHLKTLNLINYKNFKNQTFEFNSKVNCFVGSNGVGKTNILDAIYHLSFGKSYFNPIASQNIKHGEDFFVVDGRYSKDLKEEKIIVSLKKGGKKVIKRNSKSYNRFSDHIGLLPLVIISPVDRDLITEGSVLRRKFIDGVISQNDKIYLDQIIRYNKILFQRNSLLKQFYLSRTFDHDTIEIYDEQLSKIGNLIFNKRKEFLELFSPIFFEKYSIISNNKEKVNLNYKSQLKNHALQELLISNIEKFSLFWNTFLNNWFVK